MKSQLFLHCDEKSNSLQSEYQRAFTSAAELLIVSAYLTNWDGSVPLGKNCQRFRMIVGKDFGITRKSACEALLKWAPKQHKVHCRVADQIDGFHPKAVFWREPDGRAYAIIGSSNLSLAAFNSNFEANISLSISASDFEHAKRWVDRIAERSVPISSDWLRKYQESKPKGGGRRKTDKSKEVAEVLPIGIPLPEGAASIVKDRRKQINQYRRYRTDLIDLFRRCASGDITSPTFYEELPRYWSWDAGDRLQGAGWERTGKNANFRQISKSYINIIDAKSEDRDDIVVAEVDNLARQKNPARGAFLSEMLCLEFPKLYPVLNKPVRKYLEDVKFVGSTGMSDGAKYLDLALRLRLSLAQNPDHPAKSIAELDGVIWLAYHD